MDYKIGDLTKEEAAYIGEKINEIVPREVDADEEEFVLKVENEDGTVDVAGEFQIYNYKLDGDTLLTQSGGSHPGKMHLVKDGEFYKVESFDAVEDGSDYEPSAKKIFGDKYDKFVKASSNDKKMNRLRTKAIKNYVQATGINATQYQDEGWDPVKL